MNNDGIKGQTTVVVVLEDGSQRTTSWGYGATVSFDDVKNAMYDAVSYGKKPVGSVWIDGTQIARYTANETMELAQSAPRLTQLKRKI